MSWLGKTYDFGTLGPIRITADRSAFIGIAAVSLVMIALSFTLLRGTGLDRLMAALLATLGYYFWGLMHHVGHYLAGLYAGYPLVGIHAFAVLARDQYPVSEPTLSANIHLRRAIGGPTASILAAAVCLFISSIAPGGILWFTFMSGFWFNLLIFTLGALMPLPGLDGGVIRRYWRSRQA